MSKEKERREQELMIQRQVAFASGLFQADITVRTLLESLGEAVVIVDRFGTILLLNESAERMFGYPREEIIGKAHALLIPERYRAVHEKHWAHYFEEPRKRPMGFGLDLAGRRRDGSEFPVEISLSFLETINGLLILAFISDISRRKEYELHLRESEQRFASFMAHLPAAAWIKDLQGRYVYANAEAERIFSMTLPELAGKTDEEVFPPEVAEMFSENDRKVLAAAGSLKTTEVLPQSDGLRHHSIVSKFVLPGKDGQPAQVAGVAFDITDRILLEEEVKKLNLELAARAAELEAANSELEAFNYTIAHDLRQPLNAITGFCQMITMLCGDRLDERCRSYVQGTYDSALRMNRLIDELLKFSRLAYVEPRQEKVDISTIAEKVAEELKLAEPERRVVFRISGGILADGDADLLKVVLENLLGNAWKYTRRQEEAIIEFNMTEVAGKRAYFVRDNGAGFDMTHVAKLFVPFQRLPRTDEVTGHGIGLATVERIIRRHGGKVWAEGEPEKGATFYFTLH